MGDTVLRGAARRCSAGDAGRRVGRRRRIADGDDRRRRPTVGRQPGDDVVDLAGHVLLTGRRRAPRPPRQGVPRRACCPTRPATCSARSRRWSPAGPSSTVDDTVERAERAARLMAAQRVHAPCARTPTRRSTTGCAASRRSSRCAGGVADVIDVEIVALCGWPITGPRRRRPAGPAASTRWPPGADVVGGCPHLDAGGTRAATEVSWRSPPSTASASTCTPTRRWTPSVDGLADLADARDRRPGSRTRSRRATASASACSRRAPAARVAEAVAAAGIAVVALPATNLYLQGRDHQQAMPRGLTAVRALLRRRRRRGRRRRQPAGPVQPARPGVPVRDRRR